MITMYDIRAIYLDEKESDCPFSTVIINSEIIIAYLKKWSGQQFMIETEDGKVLEARKLIDRTFFRINGTMFRYNAYMEEFDVAIKGEETQITYSRS